MDRGRIVTSRSAAETLAFGKQVGKKVQPGSVICFFGELGAGKTTLIKGIISALTQTAPEEICSPTFSYLNIYEGRCMVYHFDLYRLKDVESFLSLGFEEYLFSDGVCCLEWSERIASILPKGVTNITIAHDQEGTRKIIVDYSYEIPKCQIY